MTVNSISNHSAGVLSWTSSQWWRHKYNRSLLCCNIIALISNIYKHTLTPDTMMKSTLLMRLIDFLLHVSIAEDFWAERLKHISPNDFELFKWRLFLRAVIYCVHFTFLAGARIWLKYKWPPVRTLVAVYFQIPAAARVSEFKYHIIFFFYLAAGILK